MELTTLTVERKRFNAYHIETTLKTKDGKVKAIFNSMLKQPKRGTKTIVINCFTYALNWENVPKREGYIKIKDRKHV